MGGKKRKKYIKNHRSGGCYLKGFSIAKSGSILDRHLIYADYCVDYDQPIRVLCHQ